MSRQSHWQFTESPSCKSTPSPDSIQAVPPDEILVSALAQAQRRFEATFLHAPVGIAHVALDGRFLLVNPRFCEISGYDAETLIRTGFRQITHPDDLSADETLLARLHAGELPRYTMEKRYIRADGTIIWINLTVAMIRDDADRPEFYVAVIEDQSDLRQASFEAGHDPLTGLLNRRGFACRAKDSLADGAQRGEGASLIFLDLDGFKSLNDDRGHAAGDDCLTHVARLLTAMAGAGALVARIGGDEFLVLLAGCDAAAARAVADNARRALADIGMGISGSFGLVTADTAGVTNLDHLIACADDAMRAAKRAGKNRVYTTIFA
ncbi:diguanylate cyclase [Sphingobium sp. HBC34]|uniref:Diguanylate cyclase n=1 Tax=Sphingobium cyanobacteriorum TaxID=3063954 RepID=A0ABT8ZJH3_9SPHN|nr:sensor domain-containing diguanylate cyclase [Sphingobium sp. HBC34]MDO7833935.1 diguanylate cyclase [Sphingobium sp. HBC34]